MNDKNGKKIEFGNKISFSCGDWHYEASVYDVTDDKIYHSQISEGNGEGQMRCHNRIECSRYITVIQNQQQNKSW